MSIQRKFQPLVEGDFLTRLIKNYYQNFMDVILISSRAKALHESDERSFGIGKSTLSLWFSYIIHFGARRSINRADYNINDNEIWDEVFQNLVGNKYDFIRRIKEIQNALDECSNEKELLQKKVPCLIADDVQAWMPALPGLQKDIADLVGLITVDRPLFANLILTAPSIDTIANALRKHISFEVIVYERGKAEIQQITVRKNFKYPEKDIKILRYWYDIRFDALPDFIIARYNNWRLENIKKLSELYSKELTKIDVEEAKEKIVDILKKFDNKLSITQLSSFIGISRAETMKLLELMREEGKVDLILGERGMMVNLREDEF